MSRHPSDGGNSRLRDTLHTDAQILWSHAHVGLSRCMSLPRMSLCVMDPLSQHGEGARACAEPLDGRLCTEVAAPREPVACKAGATLSPSARIASSSPEMFEEQCAYKKWNRPPGSPCTARGAPLNSAHIRRCVSWCVGSVCPSTGSPRDSQRQLATAASHASVQRVYISIKRISRSARDDRHAHALLNPVPGLGEWRLALASCQEYEALRSKTWDVLSSYHISTSRAPRSARIHREEC